MGFWWPSCGVTKLDCYYGYYPEVTEKKTKGDFYPDVNWKTEGSNRTFGLWHEKHLGSCS